MRGECKKGQAGEAVVSKLSGADSRYSQIQVKGGGAAGQARRGSMGEKGEYVIFSTIKF